MNSTDCGPSRRGRGRLLASAALILIAASQLIAASSGEPGPYALPIAVIGVFALLTAARLATAGCVESRVATAILCATILIGIALAHTVGMPGAAPTAWTLRDALVLALCAATTASVVGPSRSGSRALWRL